MKIININCYYCTKKNIISARSAKELQKYLDNNGVRCKFCDSLITHQFKKVLARRGK